MAVHLDSRRFISIHPLKSPLEALAETVGFEYREQVRVCDVVESFLKIERYNASRCVGEFHFSNGLV